MTSEASLCGMCGLDLPDARERCHITREFSTVCPDCWQRYKLAHRLTKNHRDPDGKMIAYIRSCINEARCQLSNAMVQAERIDAYALAGELAVAHAILDALDTLRGSTSERIQQTDDKHS